MALAMPASVPSKSIKVCVMKGSDGEKTSANEASRNERADEDEQSSGEEIELVQRVRLLGLARYICAIGELQIL